MPMLLLNALVLLCQQTPSGAPLTARISPNVELHSIVFRLAGNPEYNMTNSKSPYADEVAQHFGPFRDHAVVELARRLRREHGVSYDAVMSMAVHVDVRITNQGAGAKAEIREKPGLGARPVRLDARWEQDDAREFVRKLGEFAHDTKFAEFFAGHEAFYKDAAARLTNSIKRRNPVAWFDRFFGARPAARFELSVGLLNGGGCYGVSVAYENGREDVCPVIGAGRFDDAGLPLFDAGLPLLDAGIEQIVVHELCHTYTNAFVDQFADQLQPAGERLFESCADQMKRQAYGTWQTLMYESLVRATTLRYVRANHGAMAAELGAGSEALRGFTWVGKLADLLGDFEAHRTDYGTFADFMPRVVKFFDKYKVEPAKPQGQAPEVVGMVPANAAQDVDPALTEIRVTFDRPMMDGNFAVVGGGPHFPELTGQVSYDASHKVLTLPLRLKPNWEYEFWLNRGRFNSFMSADGVRLESVHVRFKTRSN